MKEEPSINHWRLESLFLQLGRPALLNVKASRITLTALPFFIKSTLVQGGGEERRKREKNDDLSSKWGEGLKGFTMYLLGYITETNNQVGGR